MAFITLCELSELKDLRELSMLKYPTAKREIRYVKSGIMTKVLISAVRDGLLSFRIGNAQNV